MTDMVNKTRGWSDSVLTIGCAYKNPKGGIAQVLKSYDAYVFDRFKFVANSCNGNKFRKLMIAVAACLKCVGILACDRKVRIVHIHTASYVSFRRSAWFVRIAKLFGKRVVMHIHGGGFKHYYETQPRFVQRVLNRCDCIIVLSESWASFIKEITICPDVRVLENIIDDPTLLKCPKDTSHFHLLFLGLITRQKGIFDLLDMLADHRAEFEGRLCLHVGGNGEVETLKNKINEYGLTDIVKYEGWVSGDRKIELFNIVNAYILPSYVEGLPISILESMSYGLPVLSTPVGGIPEVVSEDTGILFNAGDKNGMYAAIKSVMTDKAKCERMGRAAKERCTPYLPDRVRQSLMRIYAYYDDSSANADEN